MGPVGSKNTVIVSDYVWDFVDIFWSEMETWCLSTDLNMYKKCNGTKYWSAVETTEKALGI